MLLSEQRTRTLATDNTSPDLWPPSIANLRAFKPGLLDVPVAIPVLEFPLFTDARVIGEARFGPYAFLNTAAFRGNGTVQTAIVLRYAIYDREINVRPRRYDKSSAELYHGGYEQDELAALTSLILGIRVRAGSASREFQVQGDPLGTPIELWSRGTPYFSVPRNYAIPSAATGEHHLEALSRIDTLKDVSQRMAIAIVRSARMYQEALWAAESEPSMAWLLLVSALETAANEWQRSNGSPVERLQESKPELYAYLSCLSDDSILKTVAEGVSDSLGITKKFVSFVLAFHPNPPAQRPTEGFQFSWNEQNWAKALKTIYRYRSKALHDGIPFPAPMCSPPTSLPDLGVSAEIPTALAHSEKGATWIRADMPLHLHVFEYVTRHVLLKWWSSDAK
jgi:hypothetical protein